jgi:hypothetical protein
MLAALVHTGDAQICTAPVTGLTTVRSAIEQWSPARVALAVALALIPAGCTRTERSGTAVRAASDGSSRAAPDDRGERSAGTPDGVGTQPGGCGGVQEISIEDGLRKIRVDRIRDLRAAGTGESLLLTFTVVGNRGCDAPECVVYESFVVSADRAGHASPPERPPVGGGGPGATAYVQAVPVAVDAELLLLTQAPPALTPVLRPGTEPPDSIHLVRAGVVARSFSPHFFGELAPLGTGATIWIAGTGIDWLGQKRRTSIPLAARSVRLFRMAAQAEPLATLAIGRSRGGTTSPISFDGPAIAASEDHVAVAFRRTSWSVQDELAGRRPGQILVAWIDARTGKVRVPAREVASGDLGDMSVPALLLDPDGMLHIIWSEREGTDGGGGGESRGPPRVRHRVWPAGRSAPESEGALDEHAVGWAPAVARVGDGVAVAWADADADHWGRIQAGFGSSLTAAAANAAPRSELNLTRAVEGPVWAASGGRAALAWIERDAPAMKDLVHRGWRIGVTWCD